MLLAATRHTATPSAPADAPPIVLIHGLGGTQYVWDPVLEPLRAHAELITVDLPGFGDSPDVDEWSLTGAADAILDTLDELGVDRFVLVGHSLGGGVSIRLAAAHPDRVAALVLVAPAGFSGNGDGSVDARTVAIHAAWRTVVRFGSAHLLRVAAVRDRVFAPLVHDTSVIGVREAAELARGSSRGQGTVAARAAILEANLTGELPQLAMHVELVWGRQDRVVGFSHAERVGSLIPHVATHWLDEVGHLPMWEQPEAVIDAIEAAAAATA
jgi:pimeloyl-ACP methyl ester carboxylesterase